MGALTGIGDVVTDPTLAPEVNLRRRVLAGISLQSAVAAIGWGALYVAFGEPIAGLIPWTYAAVSFASLAFARTRYAWYVRTQLALILVLPFLLQLVLGGFVPGSAVVVWAFLSPLGALLVSTPRVARGLLVGFLALVVLAALLEAVAGHNNDLPGVLVASLFVLNLSGTATVTYLAMLFFIKQRDRATAQLAEERARSERLLLNVLPAPIAGRLKSSGELIADRHVAVTVLFADIVGFTPLSAELEPEDLVALLDEVVSRFDALTEARGLEKIRTIGDAYMVAAGVPDARADHALAAVDLALAMRSHVAQRRPGWRDLVLRVGIASGPAVAGIIGHLKFQYDIWGDTVTTASRMESDGLPGEIQVTEATYELVRDRYECVARPTVEVKGKGVMRTWLVVGPWTAAVSDGLPPPTGA